MGFFASSGILNRRGFFGGAKAFLPTDISGLQLWLDATTGLFDATSGGSAVTTDGSAVARWEDQSGNGRHATQTTSNNRPVLKTSIQNLKNILRFDGSNDSFKVDAFSLTTKRTFFYALSSTSNSAQILYEQSANYNNNSNTSISTIENATQISHNFRNPNIAPGGYSAKLFTTRTSGAILCAGRYNDTHASNQMEQNNTAMTGANIGGNTADISGTGNFDIFIGSRNQSQFFLNGDLFEFIIYDSELSSADRTRVANYLNAKWAIY